MTFAASTKAYWYLTRGTGVVALVLLTLSVVLGIVETVRWSSARWPRFVTAALHKNVSLLVLAFLALHIVTSIADSFAPIQWLDVVVPFAGTYRPIWLGLGAVAVDLLVALTVTSLLRERVGYRAWRLVHWSAYLCWPVTMLHGVGTGTDTRNFWILWINILCVLAVAGALAWRLAGTGTVATRTRYAASITAVLVLVGLFVFTEKGPLQPGWARRAGTPASLLGGTAAAAATGAGAPALVAPFTAPLTGLLTETGPDASGVVTVTIAGRLTGGTAGAYSIQLTGPGITGGGVQMQRSTVSIGPAGEPAAYHGEVTLLQGRRVVAQLSDGAGNAMTVTFQLTIGHTSVTGTATGVAGTAGQGRGG